VGVWVGDGDGVAASFGVIGVELSGLAVGAGETIGLEPGVGKAVVAGVTVGE
jgi:hypothetical protein